MTGSTLQRNSVFFRFASDATVEKIEFDGREIAVGDLKQAIAEKKSLPRFDLVVVNEATNETYTRDGAMLPKNMSVTVRRTPPQNAKKPSVLHVEHNDIWKAPPEPTPKVRTLPPAPVQRRACPPEYLCSLCHNIFENPHIARCCGRSACLQCFEAQEHWVHCPLCEKPWSKETTPIPNPRLSESVASLDMDYFLLPRSADKTQGGVPSMTSALDIGDSNPPAIPSNAAALDAVRPSCHDSNFAMPVPPSIPWAPPVALALRPCMLSREQFYAWQQAMKMESMYSETRKKSRRKLHSDAKHTSKRGRR